jgi:hypothetical protein
MQQRIGNLNSLPFTSDEITHKSRHDLEWFPGMVFDLSEGQGKEKSEVHHNRERINLVSWHTLALFTSNTHMQDYMSGVRAHTSQGEFSHLHGAPGKGGRTRPGSVSQVRLPLRAAQRL